MTFAQVTSPPTNYLRGIRFERTLHEEHDLFIATASVSGITFRILRKTLSPSPLKPFTFKFLGAMSAELLVGRSHEGPFR